MSRLRELPSTYVVQKHSSPEEIARLEVQDKMMTIGMGGVLPELADPTQLRRVLDVGCGTGGWLLETARTYPMIEQLVGVDISLKRVTYGRAQAEKWGLGQRVQFQIMDALQGLAFPEGSFDLVNQRAGLSWLRTWDWPKVLMEYQRVSTPSGIIRVTEPSLVEESSSPALMKLNTILLEAFHNAGYFFRKSCDGVTCALVDLMERQGIENVQSHPYMHVYSSGTQTGQYFFEDMAQVFRAHLPFLKKWTRVPVDYQEIYRQAMKEMQQADFSASGTLLTVWGRTKGIKWRPKTA